MRSAKGGDLAMSISGQGGLPPAIPHLSNGRHPDIIRLSLGSPPWTMMPGSADQLADGAGSR